MPRNASTPGVIHVSHAPPGPSETYYSMAELEAELEAEAQQRAADLERYQKIMATYILEAESQQVSGPYPCEPISKPKAKAKGKTKAKAKAKAKESANTNEAANENQPNTEESTSNSKESMPDSNHDPISIPSRSHLDPIKIQS